MAEFAIIQDTVRTGTTGTKTFTASGSPFGANPKGALFFVTTGLTNGTAADHARIGIGATDGTNNITTSMRTRDGIALNPATSDTNRRSSSTDCLLMRDQAGTAAEVKAQFSAWVTDGITLNFSTVPAAAAYLITIILFGGSGTENLAVNTVATSGTQNTAVTVNVGFEPTYLVVFSNAGGDAWDDTTDVSARITFGFVQNAGANPHPQYCTNWEEVGAQLTTSVLSSLETTTCARDVDPVTGKEVEIETFTSTGFDATTRAAAGSSTIGYIAVKLTGLSAKVMAVDSPTSGGSQQITGIGFTPQFGMLAMNTIQTTDSRITTDDAEVFAVSAFTSTAQYCHAIFSEDAETVTTNTEAVVHSRPVFLRKDNVTFMDATFTSFGNGTATFNYATNDTTARKWAGLFISDTVVSTASIAMQQTGGVMIGRRYV